MLPVIVVIVAAIVALFVIEFWYINHHEMTISEHMQRINAQLGTQLTAGLFFLGGAVTGWFIAHFTDIPPVR